jgi:hypothetical protein
MDGYAADEYRCGACTDRCIITPELQLRQRHAVGTTTYAVHRIRYATAYRIGLPALGAIARITPTRTVARAAEHYRRRAARAAEPHRYAATYWRNGRRVLDIGTDRYDIAADAEAALGLVLHRRALRALHRLDVETAAAEGRPLPR